MTTAHRPTWLAALGGNGTRDGSSGYTTRQLSVRDLTAHTLLKLRQPGQNAPEEILANRELRRELFAKERQSRELYGNVLAIPAAPTGDEQRQADGRERLLPRADDPDADVEFGSADEHEEEAQTALSDEDEEAELMRELERIRRERAKAEAAKRAAEHQRVLTSNPLLSLAPAAPDSDEFVVKRRWDDDVVFKNQSKGIDERPKKRFINDTTRSDFHRKFLDRYIK